MEHFRVIILFVCFIGATCEKISRYNDEQEPSFKGLWTVEPNLLYRDSDNNIEQARFVRHVEVAVTESIINHLMKKLRQRYPLVKKQPTSLHKMVINLRQRLHKYIQKKKPKRIKPTRIHKNIRKKLRKGQKVTEVLRRKPKRNKLNAY